MQLLYNVHYEIAAAAFLSLLSVYVSLQFDLKRARNRTFFRLLLCVVLCNLLDVVTAITISYGAVIHPHVNQLLSTLYNFTNAVVCLQFLVYATHFRVRVEKRGKLSIGTWATFVVYLVLLAVNGFTGWFFWFDASGAYQHGDFYLLIFVLPYLFFIMASATICNSFSRFELTQRISVILFIIVSTMGPVLQITLFPDVLLSVFSISLASMIILFSLETPEQSKLAVTTEALMEANAKAERASKAKTMFLANMSHEIRTPSNAILGKNEMILRESGEEEIVEYADHIKGASDTLLSLINDILDISKIEAGKYEIVETEYDLRDLLNDCYNMVKQRADSKGLSVVVECEKDIPSRLYGDGVRIRQVVNNLLTNAVKYTSEGTITFRVKNGGVSGENMTLVLSVEDTGKGMKEEDLPYLFDSFTRLDEEGNHHIEGTGLGLAITKQLVQLMGGDVDVYSEEGKGSLFYVRIPQKVVDYTAIGDFMQTKSAGSIERVRYAESFRAPKASILVVDDVPINLKVIAGLLKRTEVQVDFAERGEECLAKYMENHYDLILLDHMMPGMDGIETFTRMREMQKDGASQVPVIVLTANALSGAREEYLSLGFTDYLSKPVVGKDLEQMLLNYLPEELVEKRA